MKNINGLRNSYIKAIRGYVFLFFFFSFFALFWFFVVVVVAFFGGVCGGFFFVCLFVCFVLFCFVLFGFVLFCFEELSNCRDVGVCSYSELYVVSVFVYTYF